MDGKNGIVLPSFIFAVTKTASGSDRPSYTVSVPWSIRAPATKIGGLSLKRDRSEHGGIDVASLEFGWFQQCHKVQQNCCHMEPLQVSCSQDKSFYSLQLGNGKVRTTDTIINLRGTPVTSMFNRLISSAKNE